MGRIGGAAMAVALETDGHAHLVTTTAGIYQPVWDVLGGVHSTYTAAFRGRSAGP